MDLKPRVPYPQEFLQPQPPKRRSPRGRKARNWTVALLLGSLLAGTLEIGAVSMFWAYASVLMFLASLVAGIIAAVTWETRR